jgi:hypothetical protein
MALKKHRKVRHLTLDELLEIKQQLDKRVGIVPSDSTVFKNYIIKKLKEYEKISN